MSDKEQELNEWLAKEIMGYEFKQMWGQYLYVIPKEDNEYYPQYSEEEWNPLTNLEQAFDVLEEQYGDNAWEFWNTPNGYKCSIYGRINVAQADTKPKAIIGAICKAEGIYEEFEEVLE